MTRFARLILVGLMLMSPALAVAGPTEEANAALDRWSAAYTSNDPDSVVKNYWPDAILLGTVSSVISIGTEAIRTYFSPLKGSGNKNAVGETRAIVVSENAVVLTGFYEFTGMTEGKPVPRPSRFTMLITKRGSEWPSHITILRHTFSQRSKASSISEPLSAPSLRKRVFDQ